MRGNIGNLLKQAQAVQENLQKAQAEVAQALDVRRLEDDVDDLLDRRDREADADQAAGDLVAAPLHDRLRGAAERAGHAAQIDRLAERVVLAHDVADQAAGDELGHALGPISVELSQNGRHVSPALIAGSSAKLSNGAKAG